MEATKINFKELSKTLRLTTFLETYTILNPKGGIYHRINGKATGTHSKTKELTQDDKLQLSNGLKKLQVDINAVIKQFEKDLKDGNV